VTDSLRWREIKFLEWLQRRSVIFLRWIVEFEKWGEVGRNSSTTRFICLLSVLIWSRHFRVSHFLTRMWMSIFTKIFGFSRLSFCHLISFISSFFVLIANRQFWVLHFLTDIRMRMLAKMFGFSQLSFSFDSTCIHFFIVFSHCQSLFLSLAFSNTHSTAHFGENFRLFSAFVLFLSYFGSFPHRCLSCHVVIS
jgi:hypothetical protein